MPTLLALVHKFNCNHTEKKTATSYRMVVINDKIKTDGNSNNKTELKPKLAYCCGSRCLSLCCYICRFNGLLLYHTAVFYHQRTIATKKRVKPMTKSSRWSIYWPNIHNTALDFFLSSSSACAINGRLHKSARFSLPQSSSFQMLNKLLLLL